MVEADTSHLAGLTDKAQKLLEAGRSVKSHVKLTRREEEVLNGVMRSQANKEIAATLNLSERTVKFHVSSLLAKFRVRGRMELVREATQHTSPNFPVQSPVATREARPLVSRVMNYRGGGGAFMSMPAAKQSRSKRSRNSGRNRKKARGHWHTGFSILRVIGSLLLRRAEQLACLFPVHDVPPALM
jgi:DNA-binding CsgD family transcriptional regulator